MIFHGDVIAFFIENDFTNHDIALMLGVSKRTVENRMREYQLTNGSRYSDIENDVLDSYVQRIQSNFPRSGRWCQLICSLFLFPIKVYMIRIFFFWKSITYEVNSGMVQYFVIWASHLRVIKDWHRDMIIRWRQFFLPKLIYIFSSNTLFWNRKTKLTSCISIVENFLPD